MISKLCRILKGNTALISNRNYSLFGGFKKNFKREERSKINFEIFI